jgi:hypothetical protein
MYSWSSRSRQREPVRLREIGSVCLRRTVGDGAEPYRAGSSSGAARIRADGLTGIEQTCKRHVYSIGLTCDQPRPLISAETVREVLERRSISPAPTTYWNRKVMIECPMIVQLLLGNGR